MDPDMHLRYIYIYIYYNAPLMIACSNVVRAL